MRKEKKNHKDMSRKKSTKSQINKKRAKKSTINIRNQFIMENFECINEAMRVHKCNREKRGSWRLVPKDSREVYREQRRRRMSSTTSETDSSEHSRDSHRGKSVTIKRPPNRKGNKGQRRKRRRYHRTPSTSSSGGTSYTKSHSTFVAVSDSD